MADININNVGDDLAKAFDDGFEQGKKATMQWVSVKDRLPEKSGYYLYFSKYPHGGLQDGIGVSYFQHKVKEWKKVYTPTVTHWMPLPEPPGGKR